MRDQVISLARILAAVPCQYACNVIDIAYVEFCPLSKRSGPIRCYVENLLFVFIEETDDFIYLPGERDCIEFFMILNRPQRQCLLEVDRG